MTTPTLADIGRLDSVTELILKTPPGGVSRVNMKALADLLRVDDPSRIVVEQAHGEALVRVYPVNPLTRQVPATVDDLVMRRGRIITGRHYDDMPARLRLFDPRTGNAQRIAIFGTTGAGKSRAAQLLLAACKRNGITVHLADLKEGQSVPEAAGNVATRVTTQEGTIHLLRGQVARAHERMQRYAAMGRSGFLINRPDPLEYVVIEEANRLLEPIAKYREEGTYLVKELGRTGRSVGMGIILLAQGSHLEELGGSDTLRAMLKEGEVILLRWSSGMMQQLVSDGLLERGAVLQPIPKVIGRVQRLRRYHETADDIDDEPNSQGMAYHLTSARPDALLRFSLVGSVEPCEGFDPLILDLYGSGPAPGEPLVIPDGPPEGTTVPPAAGGTEAGVTSSSTPKAARLADRILVALDKGPLDTYGVLEALKRDGGKTARLGSVRNALLDLRRDGRIISEDGTHTLT